MAFVPYCLPCLSNGALRQSTGPLRRARGRNYVSATQRRVVHVAALEAPVKEDVRTNLERLFKMPTAPDTQTAPSLRRSNVDPGKKAKVLLLNDSANERSHVARVLQKVCPELSPDQAWAIMMQAHKNGSAVVGIYPFEQGELICEMLRSNGLLSEITEV